MTIATPTKGHGGLTVETISPTPKTGMVARQRHVRLGQVKQQSAAVELGRTLDPRRRVRTTFNSSVA